MKFQSFRNNSGHMALKSYRGLMGKMDQVGQSESDELSLLME